MPRKNQDSHAWWLSLTQEQKDKRRVSALKWQRANKEKIREYDHARWAALTPEQREQKRERLRKWQETHRERTHELSANFRALHPEKNRENARRQRTEKREQWLAAIKRWRAANPDKVRIYGRQREGREKGATGRFTPKDIALLFAKQQGICAGCSIALIKSGKGKYHIDHIIPLKPRNGGPSGTNDPSNLQLLCPRCNCSKHNRTMDEWWPIEVRYA